MYTDETRRCIGHFTVVAVAAAAAAGALINEAIDGRARV